MENKNVLNNENIEIENISQEDFNNSEYVNYDNINQNTYTEQIPNEEINNTEVYCVEYKNLLSMTNFLCGIGGLLGCLVSFLVNKKSFERLENYKRSHKNIMNFHLSYIIYEIVIFILLKICSFLGSLMFIYNPISSMFMILLGGLLGLLYFILVIAYIVSFIIIQTNISKDINIEKQKLTINFFK